MKWPSYIYVYTNTFDSSHTVVETRNFSRTGLLVSTSQPAEPMNHCTTVPVSTCSTVVILYQALGLDWHSSQVHRDIWVVPVVSMICSTVVDFIYNLHGHKITEYNHNILNPASLQIYANAVIFKRCRPRLLLWFCGWHS